MSGFDIYVFILCLIVFSMLTVLFFVLISTIVKLTLRLILSGELDKEIEAEYVAKRRKSRAIGCLNTITSVVICVLLLLASAFSIYVNLQEDATFEKIPTLKVVSSGSMATKNESNLYLWENNIDNQIQTFDLILTYKLPEESDLKLYDIVVYEVDNKLVVHRIVRIEEPNASHPDERHFMLQGDAVETPDWYPVRYSQMKSIYRNQRIPFVGSFILFMQSPAGWLCILLLIFAMVATPWAENKIEEAKKKRLIEIDTLQVADASCVEVEDTV